MDPQSHRRSVYRFIVRSQQQPFMTTLDCADRSLMVAKHKQSPRHAVHHVEQHPCSPCPRHGRIDSPGREALSRTRFGGRLEHCLVGNHPPRRFIDGWGMPGTMGWPTPAAGSSTSTLSFSSTEKVNPDLQGKENGVF